MDISNNDLVRERHGSPHFYKLLEEAANTHDRKSHDYASNENPYGNYHFAGQVAAMFVHCPEDAGFAGRIAEKIYRLANLEGGQKIAKNESIEDTEVDIFTIMGLWIADRRNRRLMDGASPAGGLSPEQLRVNPLQTEIKDLLRMMPDAQLEDLIQYSKEVLAMHQYNHNQSQAKQRS